MIKSHELLQFMSPQLATDILEFTFQSDKDLYRLTLQNVAERRKVRPIFLERKSREERHKSMAATLCSPTMELFSSNLIRHWLLKKHTTMLTRFLDALGIQHEDGVIDELPESVDTAKLHNGVEDLLANYPHELVAVYLYAFNSMEESGWDNLSEMLDSDPRLELGQTAVS